MTSPWRRASLALLLGLTLLLGVVAPVTAAIRQDGTSTQHLASPAGGAPGSGDVTILQWHKLNVDHNAIKILLNWHDNNEGGVFDQVTLLTQSDGTTADFDTIIGGAISQSALAAQSITVGTWYYYVLTRSGSAIKLYVGTESTGVSLIASLTDSSLEAQGTFWRWTATGTTTATLSADASVAQFRLYNRLLSTTEMDTERCSATSVSSTNLWTSNPFATAGSYGADAGSNQMTFTEQGGTNFTTVGGPAPSCGGGGTSAAPGSFGLMGVGR